MSAENDDGKIYEKRTKISFSVDPEDVRFICGNIQFTLKLARLFGKGTSGGWDGLMEAARSPELVRPYVILSEDFEIDTEEKLPPEIRALTCDARALVHASLQVHSVSTIEKWVNAPSFYLRLHPVDTEEEEPDESWKDSLHDDIDPQFLD